MKDLGFDALIEESHAFHAQPIYKGVEAGAAKKRIVIRYLFAFVRWGKRSTWCNALLLAALLLVFRGFRYPAADRVVFEYGPTRNNMAAFKRLNACLPPDIVAKIDVNGHFAPVGRRLALLFSPASLWRAARALQCNHHDRPLPHIQAAIAVAAYLLYSRYPLPQALRVLCVASDHSPVSMALLTVARATGIKTCYLQHAPVTEYFPPLSYDLSILYDQASLEAYDQAARRRGVAGSQAAIIFPPYDEEFEQPRLRRAPPLIVGVCLSSVPQVGPVQRLVEDVCAHPAVSGALLRCHPRYRIDTAHWNPELSVALQEEGQSLGAFLEAVDLVLVPNSGVAIEALHQGRPTFYTDGMDEIQSDYYRFVAEGILPEFSVTALDDPAGLDAFFDASWKARFARHDATVNFTIQDAREAVASSFASLIEAS
ncbi:MAG: hypothetical protein AAFR88_01425 [Pseudomonadota bacterium]